MPRGVRFLGTRSLSQIRRQMQTCEPHGLARSGHADPESAIPCGLQACSRGKGRPAWLRGEGYAAAERIPVLGVAIIEASQFRSCAMHLGNRHGSLSAT